jgi:alpha-glucosidase
MMKATSQVLALVLGLVLAHSVRADDTQTLPDGVALKIGSAQVELRVASAHAFRLHIFSADAPASPQNIYVNGHARDAAPFTVTHDGSIVGLKTAFGELRVDTEKQTWSLSDSAGTVLTDWAPWKIGAPGRNPGDLGSSGISCGASAQKQPRFYGSGDSPHLGALVQTEGAAGQGNGTATLPQYWSTAGYGALLFGQVENRPAAWKSNPAGGVDWTVPGSSLDCYLVPAQNLYDWLRGDAEVTGFAPVPPRWALGYMQSRWGWESKTYIDDTLARFRHDQLPVDVFIFDFEWYTKTPDYDVPPQGYPTFADFDWNPVLFPDPVAQLQGFAQEGLHMVGIRKPRLGNSANLVLMRSKGWILAPDSQNKVDARNLDFANPALRAWYEDKLRKFDEQGVAGFWNDEGELAFSEYSYWNLAEAYLLKKVKPDSRFWSINRSYAPGLQRFGAAFWSGDIASDWPTLAQTPGRLLAGSLSGMPYTACDIGGFTGSPSPEMLVRWIQAGVFFPVMRSHSTYNVVPRFPWLHGPEAEDAIRKALDLRYRLIPYYDSLAHENHRSAAPLMRPLVMEFPDDEKVSNETSEWLMGSRLLAAPVLQAGGARSVYLPKDRWFTFDSNQTTEGPQTVSVTEKLDEIPVYVRAGTLLPLGPVIQDTEEKSSEPLEVQIYPGHDASFNLVEDDGKTLAYKKGDVRITRFTWNDQTQTLSWSASGPYESANRFHAVNAVLFAPQGKVGKKAELGASGSLAFSNSSLD